MSVTITIPAERLARWHRRWAERITPGLLAKAAGGALNGLLIRHLARVSETRHATAARLGATPTGFWKDAEKAVALRLWQGDAEVSVTHPGIARAVRDVTIRPRLARALAIPLSALSYGLRPREAEQELGRRIFRPKGTRLLVAARKGRKGQDKAWDILYALSGAVFQKRDPTLLPDAKTIDDTLARAALNALDAEARAAAQ